ncbi:aldehyde dehydrogenase family protein [Nocardia arthritidis]|uniref:Aldehyde dehydrogenase family protein n=1 Tax=Nocardia arthritidis TaxID=228602 RepID=A0A6G9YM31_9NOCA|nr:aldehyde dehydrogenase family protein [Nocardia arthritidis]QIS14252.1 aldehyde dehydrogenase family protein [Nocardia arthritidis]
MLLNERGEQLSTSQFTKLCRDLGAVYREHGMHSEDRVVLSGENSAEFVLSLFALLELGVSVCLLDRRLLPDVSVELLSDSGATWFVSDHDHLDAEYDRLRIRWLSIADAVAQARAGGSCDDVPVEPLGLVEWARRGDGLVIWSSGSTGRPKGIVRSAASVLRNVDRTLARMGYRESDVLLPLLPFTHQYGFSLLLLWWRSGSTLLAYNSSSINAALHSIIERRVTVVDAVPASYLTMLRIMEKRKELVPQLDSVRMWCVGGEPLSTELATTFLDRTGKPLLDGYGSSEVGNIALANLDNPVYSGQPVDGVRVEVIGNVGAPVPAGVVGEIVVHSPDTMVGVLEPGGRVRPVKRHRFHTDDVGFLDAQGNLRVLGRKNAVHRFGHTLYPDALAEKASACGAPVRVIPVDSAERGTQLVFFVEDAQERPVAHWRQLIRPLLAEHERPNKVIVLREFPLNNIGKTDRKALTEAACAATALHDAKSSLSPLSLMTATGDLANIPFTDRAAALTDVVKLLRERSGEVMELLTKVCNRKTARDEIDTSINALNGAVSEVARSAPPEIDQLAVLMPSNIPLYSYVLYLLIPSLYTRRVVFRPSRRIADVTRKLHDLLGGVHGLPIVLDESEQNAFLEGEGAKSAAVVFTGAYDNAQQILSSLRPDQLFIYFGQGVNPFVVGADAQVSDAVDGLLRARMLNSGQDCFGPDVAFVHTSISAHFCNLLCRRVDALRYGGFDDPMADYGPMFYMDAFDGALEYLRKHRQYVAAGGSVELAEGHLRPTVLIRPADTQIKPAELFAPIFNIVPFSSVDWLHTMLRHPYYEERAMAATVYGNMPETVELLGQKHAVSINETILDIENGNEPFGGRGIRANYVAFKKKRHARPLLLSRIIAEYLGEADRAGGLAS